MSIPFSGTLRRSGGVVSAIGKQIKRVNLKAAKRITVKFDPFGDNVTHTRNFLHYISSPKISLTNPNCVLKTDIVCDRSEPTVEVSILPSIAAIKHPLLDDGLPLNRVAIIPMLGRRLGNRRMLTTINQEDTASRPPVGLVAVYGHNPETAKLQKVVFKSGNLTCLELFQLLNKHVSSLAPVETPVSSIQTKLEKKKTKKK